MSRWIGRAVRLTAAATLLASTAGCTALFENDMSADLARHRQAMGPERGDDDRGGPRVTFSGRLEQYLDYALKNSSSLHACPVKK